MPKNCAFILFTIIGLFVNFTIQQDLVAGVSISDGQNKVNQQATYRFTLIPEELSFDSGTIIKTYLPSSVTLKLSATNTVSICRSFIKMTSSTQDLHNCIYSDEEMMVQFTIPTRTTFDVAYEYEIAYFQNPSVSTLVYGFRITILTSNGNVLYDTTVDAAAVYIQPGEIVNQSISESSLKVSDTATYSFKFQITNSIPANGYIQVIFPSEIAVPSGIQNSDTRVKIYDQSWQTGSIAASTTSITFMPALGSAIDPDSTKYIQIEIQKVTNPKSLKETSSFSLATTDQMLNKIDQASTLMTVKTTIPGDIQIFSVGPQTNPQVGQTTDINFNLQLAQPYENGGYILVTFPSEVVVKTLTCFPFIGFVTQDSNCQFTSTSPQIVKISNSISSTRLFFLISSVQNPSSTKTTSTFKIQAYDSSNYLMSQILTGVTYSSTPAGLKTVTSVRAQTEINIQVNNNLTLNLMTTNALVNGDQFYVKIPYEQMLVNQSGFSCSIKIYLTTTIPNCILDNTSNSSFFTVTIPAPCSSGCVINSQFTLTLFGVKNTQWKVSPVSKSIEIQTMTSDLLYIKDRKITAIYTTPDLIEGTLQSIVIAKYYQIVNQPTELDVQFKLLNNIPSSGYIRIYLPDYAFYNPSSGSILCGDLNNGNATLACSSSLNTESTKGISYIQISNKCTTQCDASTTIKIKISSLKNRESVKPIENRFSIRTFTSESYVIDLGNSTSATGLTLLPAVYSQLSIISPVSLITAGSISTYQFKIVTVNGITATTGILELLFPSEIEIISSLNPTCTATVNTQSLTCQLSKNSTLLTIKHTISGQNFASQNILVTISNSTYNPKTTKPSSNFIVSTSLYDTLTSSNYLVDYDNSSLSVTANVPNVINNITAIRSNNQINQEVEFVVSFTTTNPIPRGSKIIIALPFDQVVFKNEDYQIYDNLSGTKLTELVFNNGQETSIFASLTLQEWCSGSNIQCPAGQFLSLKFANVYNPSSTKLPSFSIQIQIQYEDSYYTDQRLQDIFATPLLSNGPFKSVQISESSHVIGDLSDFTITIVINNQMPSNQNGTLLIQFPSDMYYQVSNKSISCLSGSAIIECHSIVQQTALGYYYSSLQIVMNCLHEGCGTNSQRNFTVKNMRNRFNSQSFDGQFILQSFDSENLTYDASTININDTSLSKKLDISKSGKLISFTRSNNTVSQQTDLNIDFQTNTVLQKNSVIQIFIPKDQFTIDNSISCKNKQSGSTIQCQINALLENNDYYGLQFAEFCTQTNYCSDNYTYSLVIKGFKNRYNAQNSSKTLKFSTFTPDNYAVEVSNNELLPSNMLLATSALISSTFTLSNNLVGEQTTMIIEFNLNNELKIGDSLEICFTTPMFQNNTPSSLRCELQDETDNISKAIQCQISSSIEGGFIKCLSIVNMEFAVTNGHLLSLMIKDIGNLKEEKPWQSEIQIKAYTLPDLQISKGSLTLNQSVMKANEFKSVVVARDNNDLASNTQVMISYSSNFTLLQNSKLVIQISKTQFTYTQGDSLTCKYQDISMACTVSQDSDYITVTTSSTLCSTSSQCTANSVQEIIIQGLKNPEQVSPLQKSIILTQQSQDGYAILKSYNQEIYAYPPIRLGELIDLTIKQNASLIVGDLTSYQISFKLPSNLTSKDKVYIQFPSTTVLTNNQQSNNLICKDLSTQNAYSCKISQTQGTYISVISIDNYCQVSTCSSSQIQYFQISNIRNVEYQRPRNTYTFQVMAVTESGFVMSTGLFNESNLKAFELYQLKSFGASRDQTKPGVEDIDLTLTFKAELPIPEGSLISYTIPKEQVTFKDPYSLVCITNQPINCIPIINNQSLLVVQVTEWCTNGGCLSGQNMTMVIKRGINPNSLSSENYASSFGVYVETKELYGIQTIASGIKVQPPLDGIELTNILVAREQNLVGEETFLQFIVPINSALSQDSALEIKLPSGISYEAKSKTSKCYIMNTAWTLVTCDYTYYEKQDQYELKQISKVLISNICKSPNACKGSQDFHLRIKFQQTNPFYGFSKTKDNSDLKIYLKSNDIDTGFGLVNNTLPDLEPNEIKASFLKQNISQAESCYKTGDLCQLQINLTTNNPIPKNNDQQAWLQLDIPSQMRLSSSSSCSALLFTKKIECKVTGNMQIQLRHNENLENYGSFNYAFYFSINITNIKNPFSTEKTSAFILSTYVQEADTKYKVDDLKQELTYQIDIPSPFQTLSITRNHNGLSQKTSLTFKAKLENPIPQNGEIMIQIPEAQAIIIKDSLISCYLGVQIQSLNNLVCQFVEPNIIEVNGVCQLNGGCKENAELIITFAESFLQNPPYYKDDRDSKNDSIIIASQYQSAIDNNTYLIDRTDENAFALPELLISQVNINDVTIDNFNTSNQVEIFIQASYQESNIYFSKDYLRIKFSPQILNIDRYRDQYAFVNNEYSAVSLVQSQENDLIDFIIIECGSKCKQQNKIDIKIGGIKNSYFKYQSLNLLEKEQFSLYVQELYDSPDKIISQGYYGIKGLVEKLILSDVRNAQIYQSNTNLLMGTSVEILFNLHQNPKIDKDSNITIQLPTNYTITKQNLSCAQLFEKKQKLSCIYDQKTNKLVILDYFEDYPYLSNTAIALNISGITNPNITTQGQLILAISNENKLYAYEYTQFQLLTQHLTTDCYDGCLVCSNIDGQCLQCEQPSKTPILFQGACVERCQNGYFEQDYKCYKCSEDCQQCQSFDQCTTCSVDSQVLIDGICIDSDKCPSGSFKNDKSQCTSNQDCNEDCDFCGQNKKYCSICDTQLVQFNGLCIDKCPQGYYQNDKSQCMKCDSLCKECDKQSSQCTSCKDGIYTQNILDIPKHKCVSECNDGSILRKDDPKYCDGCGQKCQSCSLSADNCTSCYFDKKSLEDLFLLDNQCLSKCPISYYDNYETHQCEAQTFTMLSFPPMFLVTSVVSMGFTVGVSKFLANRVDHSGDIALALLTQIEFMNRLFLLGNLWGSTKTFSFCVTGMNIMINAFIAIYFATLVIEPICNQLSSAVNSNSFGFKLIVGLSQITGINTIRLLTSRLFGMSIFSNKLDQIVYYVKHLEIISLISTVLCVFQLFTGVSCIFDFSFAQDSMGLGVNSIILNTILIAAQSFKYYKSLALAKTYSQVGQV